MREFSSPALGGGPAGGLADSVFDRAEREPRLTQSSRWADGAWVPVSAARFRDEVLALAKGLLTRGVRYGDRVAVMSATRWEWTLFDYALWSIGAIPVPVYPTAAPDQVRWILAETAAVACVVEDEDQAMTVGAVCDALPELTGIWQLDRDCVAQLSADGAGVPDALVHRQRLAVTPDSMATIVYTSGTTGRPKGCLLTHGNLASVADALLAGWAEVFHDTRGEQPATLLFLPLAHVYGRITQVAAVRGGIRIGHHAKLSSESLLPALAAFEPTFLHAVPYVFEKIHRRAREAAEEAGKLELFVQAERVAVEWAAAWERRAHRLGPGPSPALRLRHAAYERMVYQRVRAVLGGRVRAVMSGGAMLGRELGLFFAGAGMTVYEGYGLTESAAAVTANPPRRPKFGTVGRPVPGSTVAIAEDGEVWVKGPGVFSGYLNHPRCSDEALCRGWLATGDLGVLDEDGYLTLTGRKKEVIVTSSGKNMAPAVLEERVRAHPLIAQCLIVGENRPYLAALITLDAVALAHWLRARGRPRLDVWEALVDPELHQEVQRAVGAANTSVSRAESIRAFRLLPREFSVEDGLLTPSLKIRRAAVVERYAEDIEELYAG
ncbi:MULTISPECIES: AMP-dependent synthetase/ligase [Kitasatospora]|uniref:Putative long-chain fatty-acid--CoA ligase n=1 Tax=Kitasatospora setae (strain ATCC 33774 / DSM 43861 / JCM 3304 / KCC A-0304 / NBRC 14216 / KM-6054) TaxID=452652 RepID=E4N1K8_KITSK|nr:MULTISPECIES: AMP-dependent synthetase/ligase [Kitasatospora]BAJ32042.1 putative long-chain fatty-acid--CoA ligase [Kitasatospora setae KM-6054]